MRREHNTRHAWEAALAAGALAIAAHAQEMTDPRLRAELVAEGLGVGAGSLTTTFAFLRGDLILAARRDTGRVVRIDLEEGGVAAPGAVVRDLDIIVPHPNDPSSEYGVQGLVLHPGFVDNGFVYVRYDLSPNDGRDTLQSEVVLSQQGFSASIPTRNVIDRFIWDPQGNGGNGALVFDSRVRDVVVDTRYHHGGPIRFGPDGKLYVIDGDLRRVANTGWRSQTAGALFAVNLPNGVVADHAVIVRLNDDGSIPDDNPFDPDDPNVPDDAGAWYAYGVRNSFGLSFDPATGNLWATENGEANYDEVNLVQPGFNSGHLRIMGPLDHPRQPGNIDKLVVLPGSAYRDPAFAWWDCIGATGICFLHGSALGSRYDDSVLVGGFNSGFLWRFRLDEAREGFVFGHAGLQDRVDDRSSSNGEPNGTEAEELCFGRNLGANFLGIVAIECGPDGCVYVLNGLGRLYRIRRDTTPADLTSAEVTRGMLLGGGVSELSRSDDAALRTRSGFGSTLTDLHSMDLRIRASTSLVNPQFLWLTVESRIDQPTGAAAIRLWNWAHDRFDTVGQATVGATDAVLEIEDIPAAEYVTEDGRIEVLIRHIVVKPVFAFTFESYFDHVLIEVE